MCRPSHALLFWSYLRIGATAFGGGWAALPVFEAELVRRRQWLLPAEVAEAYAISQSVPGVIIVNFAVISGLRISNRSGAILAAFAVALPAFFIILALAAFLGDNWNNRWVNAALDGLRPAVAALVFGAAFRLARTGLRSPLFLLGASASALLLLFRVAGPVPLILMGALLGLAGHAIRRKPEKTP